MFGQIKWKSNIHKKSGTVHYVTYSKYCHVACVTIDWVWIGEYIYWPLTGHNYKQLKHSRYFHTLRFTRAHCLVFRSFQLAAPTMAIPLPLAQILSSQTPAQNCLSSNLVSCLYNLVMEHIENIALLSLCLCLLLWKRGYRAVDQKRPWYIRPYRNRCIATPIYATLLPP
jgi:hypothetical protein